MNAKRVIMGLAATAALVFAITIPALSQDADTSNGSGSSDSSTYGSTGGSSGGSDASGSGTSTYDESHTSTVTSTETTSDDLLHRMSGFGWLGLIGLFGLLGRSSSTSHERTTVVREGASRA